MSHHNKWYRFIPPKNLIDANIPLAIRKGCTHWVRFRSGRMLSLNADLKKAFETPKVDQKNIKDSYPLERFKRTQDGLFLADLKSDPELESLYRFEEEEHVEGWASENGLEKIEFPRYQLHFQVKRDALGKKRAYMDGMPGFFLSDEQACPFYPFLKRYLIIQNAK